MRLRDARFPKEQRRCVSCWRPRRCSVSSDAIAMVRPLEALRRAQAAASSSVEFVLTRFGGHTGFIGGRLPWRAQYWAEDLMVTWTAKQCGY